jgi:hypothetical protein
MFVLMLMARNRSETGAEIQYMKYAPSAYMFIIIKYTLCRYHCHVFLDLNLCLAATYTSEEYHSVLRGYKMHFVASFLCVLLKVVGLKL